MAFTNFWQFDPVAVNNVDLGAGVPLGEGLTFPSMVNDGFRNEMAMLAGYRNSLGYPAIGGTVSAMTLTPAPALTAYADGQIFTFTGGATDNTSTTPTLAVSGLSAITVKKVVGGALAALSLGDIKAIGRHAVQYNAAGTALVLLNPAAPSLADGTQLLMVDAGAAVGPTLDLFRDSASPAVNDLAGRVNFSDRNSAAAKITYGGIYAKLLNVTAGTELSSLIFETNNFGAPVTMTFDGNGLLTVTALTYNKGAITTGTYTPTLTNTTNVAASTTRVFSFSRNGDAVTVWGNIDIDVTSAATNTTMGISLPIASNFATSVDCGGSAIAFDTAVSCYAIVADVANDRAQLNGFSSASVANLSYAIHFSYRII